LDAPIQAALEPVKLFNGIGKRCRDIGSRCAVQAVHLDSRAPEAAFRRER
jgi:hypothetical protein